MKWTHMWRWMLAGVLSVMFVTVAAHGQQATDSFAAVMARMKAAKPEVMQRQQALLGERYDLSNHPAAGITMSRGKPVQEGVRAKLPAGVTWEQLAAMSPEQIREKDIFPKGFLPLPHPNHPEGGMLFPQVSHRRDQEAGGARSDALRPGLRPARSLAAGVSGADLPDHPARPGRRLAGQAGHHRQLLRAVQRDPQSQADRGPAAPGDAVPAAAVQPDRGSPIGEGRAAASPASIATPTATPTRRHIWSATSVRRSSAIASIRLRCVA